MTTLTQCRNGHDMTPDNIRREGKNVRCRQCLIDAQAAWRAKKGIVKGGQGKLNRQKTHCKHSHEFTPENTFYDGTNRKCRECKRLRRSRKNPDPKKGINDGVTHYLPLTLHVGLCSRCKKWGHFNGWCYNRIGAKYYKPAVLICSGCRLVNPASFKPVEVQTAKGRKKRDE